MSARLTVLLLGATGRTGRCVMEQLLGRGIGVRTIVRSARRLPADAANDPRLTVVEADLLSLDQEDLLGHVSGCDAVISCLGHTLILRGIFGPPRDLVTRATARLCRAIEALRPGRPVKFILMSSVSVHRPGGLDAPRGAFERAFVWALRGVLPPARDNQDAANFLHGGIGVAHPFVEWMVVRPDTLLESGAPEYTIHEGLVSSLFAPGSSSMANVAHFMCESVVSPEVWTRWKGTLPVIVDAGGSRSRR
ncbi:MAG: NAD(P)H-binding protein [Candidatus Eisenbacteria bacterium]|nr:NAD(P)H-binding protein [Candidatus Eisenbacteria bacterium]